MKAYLITICLACLLLGCNKSEDNETELILLNEKLSGLWIGQEYTLDGENLYGVRYDSFDIIFTIDTTTKYGNIFHTKKWTAENIGYSNSSQNYILNSPELLWGAIHSTVEYSVNDNLLEYSYFNSDSQIINMTLIKDQ